MFPFRAFTNKIYNMFYVKHLSNSEADEFMPESPKKG